MAYVQMHIASKYRGKSTRPSDIEIGREITNRWYKGLKCNGPWTASWGLFECRGRLIRTDRWNLVTS